MLPASRSCLLCTRPFAMEIRPQFLRSSCHQTIVHRASGSPKPMTQPRPLREERGRFIMHSCDLKLSEESVWVGAVPEGTRLLLPLYPAPPFGCVLG